MPTLGPSIRALILRGTSTSLRSSSSQIHTQFLPQLNSRPPTPPPAPSYQTRNHTILAPTTQWTRFNTPYTLSSVRTFTSTSTSSTSSPTTPSPNPSRRYSSSSTTSSISSTSSASATPPTPPGTTLSSAQDLETTLQALDDLYNTAQDEFEMAVEETQSASPWAEKDRVAARESLESLQKRYRLVLEGDDLAVAEEVKRRFGKRIYDLGEAVEGLEGSVAEGV